jgi:hypothetical protein
MYDDNDGWITDEEQRDLDEEARMLEDYRRSLEEDTKA